MKRLLALLLVFAMLLPVMTGCKAREKDVETKPAEAETKPAVKEEEPPEEAKVLKILTLGHSLTVDSCHMLNMVAHTEGYADMLIGTLYYSGCPLYKHVNYLKNDEPAYNLYLSSTMNPNIAPETQEGVTMKYALNYEYWDVVVMQAGVFEVAKSGTYTDGNIQIIQNYVKEHVGKINPNFIFAWHMPWAFPVDNDLRDTFGRENNGYYTNYEEYDHNRTNLYNAMTKCVGDHIVTDETFQFLIPSGTAVENALSSYMVEKDLHRDYAHGSDFTCLMAAYVYFCCLTGKDHLDEIKVDVVPSQFFRRPNGKTEWVLTDHEKELMLECINNALKEPLKVTPSKFTEKPAQ